MICHACQNIHFKPHQELTREEKEALIAYFATCDMDIDDIYGFDERKLSDNDIDDFLLELDLGCHDLYAFHHPNWESLRKAADNGCGFCYQVEKLLEDLIYVEDEALKVYLNFNPHMQSVISDGREQEYQGALRVCVGWRTWSNLRVRDKQDLDHSTFIGQHDDGNLTTGSTTNLDLAARWLENCTKKHTHCSENPQKKTPLPLRVLDLGNTADSEKICLSVGEKGKERFGSYIALSYCWGTGTGKAPLYCTTAENIDNFKSGVDIHTLPKTFIDSILLCKHLGVNYIWIDAMCIIQGDANDWNEQAPQMGDIYSNAIFTIAAATGDNSQSGLFVDRDPRPNYPATLNCQYTTEDGLTTSATFLTCKDFVNEKRGHLDTRGWTFQEYYLPSRTLRFSQFGMYWSCSSINASEAMPMGIKPSNNKSDYDNYIRKNKKIIPTDWEDKRRRYSWWYQAMTMYSDRTFTKECDRLIALSGLAANFQESRDDFVYGLWKSDIAHGLAWRLYHGEPGDEEVTKSPHLPSSSLPSWSWSSKAGMLITYDGGPPKMWTNMDNSINDYSRHEPSQCHEFIEVVNEGPKKLNQSAPATGSYDPNATKSLMVRGLLAKVQFESCKNLSPNRDGFLVASMAMPYWPPGYRKIVKGIAFFDSNEQAFPGDDLYILPLFIKLGSRSVKRDTQKDRKEFCDYMDDAEIASLYSFLLEKGIGMLPEKTWCVGSTPYCSVKEEETLCCLILKKSDEEEMKFRRLGYVEVWDGKLVEGESPTVLTLV
ncbi:HET domain-containing protein [Rutstroemia sp. NJR-2017a BBW]|nr:HET domain-containing protein [Rutstroemia sp. NJR-2017a BBW]